MRGIILAGGSGTRLHPLTRAVSKQLLPVYDKPMIYYPLSTLMMAGIREVLVITTPEDADQFVRLLGESFLDGDSACLVLGDNIFYGTGLGSALKANTAVDGGHVFAYHVANPRDYGVVEFDDAGRVVSIAEKPEVPRSRFAVPGLYFYGSDVVDVAKSIVPSARGELEITSVNDHYLRQGRLTVTVLDRGTAWLDTGTFETLMHAAEFVRVVEKRQGLRVGCVEEVAWREGWIDDDQLRALAQPLTKSGYGDYLLDLLDDAS